jgi:CheY-like chemotaxis protein
MADVLAGVVALVVEDHADTLDLWCFALDSVGATVVGVASVADALDRLKTVTPTVIISDVGLPDQTGLDFIRQVRTMPDPIGHLPAIAISGFSARRDQDAALAAGFDGHLVKPVPPEQAIAAVLELLARNRAPDHHPPARQDE